MKKNLTTLPPLALYIHFPWCIQKCPYCDFNSHAMKSGIPEERYIDALLKDLENDLPLVWGRKVTSIFMGGGTPSLFSPNAIEVLLSGIRARIPISPNAEITMEANPGSIENERLTEFRDAGVNRLSLGIQSFDDEKLKTLGRIHDSATAINAIELAKNADFDNFNLDLMFALPNQTIEEARKDLELAIKHSPTHISYYQLTIEPNTAFHNSPPPLPDNDLSWEMHEQGKQVLAKYGFSQYEVSAYSQPGKNCKHNQNYWQFGDYLGIGAGAHAKITDGNTQEITRYWKHKHPQQYMESVFTSANSGQRNLDNKELVFEFLLNALRLNEGFSHKTFSDHTGLSPDELKKCLTPLIEDRLINWDAEHKTVNTTEKGWNFLNEVLERCLPEN